MTAMRRPMIIPSHLTHPPKVGDKSVGTDLLFDAIFPIDAVGPEIWRALHGWINDGTRQRAPNNSSIELSDVRVLDFDLGCLLNDQIPRHRCQFSWSLPLALKLGEHFMSTSNSNSN